MPAQHIGDGGRSALVGNEKNFGAGLELEELAGELRVDAGRGAVFELPGLSFACCTNCCSVLAGPEGDIASAIESVQIDAIGANDLMGSKPRSLYSAPAIALTFDPPSNSV